MPQEQIPINPHQEAQPSSAEIFDYFLVTVEQQLSLNESLAIEVFDQAAQLYEQRAQEKRARTQTPLDERIIEDDLHLLFTRAAAGTRILGVAGVRQWLARYRYSDTDDYSDEEIVLGLRDPISVNDLAWGGQPAQNRLAHAEWKAARQDHQNYPSVETSPDQLSLSNAIAYGLSQRRLLTLIRSLGPSDDPELKDFRRQMTADLLQQMEGGMS
jgi:hypothetical protein